MSSDPATTATTAGAREHARSQSGAAAEHRVHVPASTYPDQPGGVDPAGLVWAERVAPGGYASRALARGTRIRLTDATGEACAHVLLWRSDATWERLCVADTVKVQWQAYLGAGSVLLSDQARVLATINADTTGHHDTVCGASSRLANEARYGDGAAHGPSPAGHELLVLAAAKHGLGRRDVPPCLSFFKGVRVDPASGALRWLGSPGPGVVELTAEMDVVVAVADTAHPADPRPDWTCGPLEVLAWPVHPTAPGDPQWGSTPERGRAYANTAEVLAASGSAR